MALSDSGASSSGSSTGGVRSDTASPPPLPKVPISAEASVSKGGGVDEWLETAKKCKFLPEADMKRLCDLVKEFLMEGKARAHELLKFLQSENPEWGMLLTLTVSESNIQPVKTPVTVCGDIHGQFYDLIELFRVGGGYPDQVNYVFLGDFVDRGYFSLETFTLLMCLKAKYRLYIHFIHPDK